MSRETLMELSAYILLFTAGAAAVAYWLSRPDPTRFAVEFKEPGSGLWMPLDGDVWYLLSDSGSAYSAGGFLDWESAYRAALALMPASEVGLPLWRPGTSDWDNNWHACNVLCSSHLYAFWRTTDADMLEYR